MEEEPIPLMQNSRGVPLRGLFSLVSLGNSILSNTCYVLFWIVLWIKLDSYVDIDYAWAFTPLILEGVLNTLAHAYGSFSEVISYSTFCLVSVTWPPFVVTLVLTCLKLRGGLIHFTWVGICFPVLAVPLMRWFCMGYVLRLVPNPQIYRQFEMPISNTFRTYFIALLFVSFKLDGHIILSWGSTLWIYWLYSSIAVSVSVVSVIALVLFFRMGPNIIPDDWIPVGNYMVNGARARYLVVAFFAWISVYGCSMFLSTLFVTLTLDSYPGLAKSTFFIPLITMYTSSVLLYCYFSFQIRKEGLIIPIAEAIDLGIPGANSHPSLGKCPLCRESIRAILEMDSDGNVMRSKNADGEVNPFVGQLVRTSANVFRLLRGEPLPDDNSEDFEAVRMDFPFVEEGDDSKECYVCTSATATTVFMDCGHSGVCWQCAEQVLEGIHGSP